MYVCSGDYIYGELDHSVQLIGYTEDGDWILKNSWETDWADGGFAILSGKDGENCDITNDAIRLYVENSNYEYSSVVQTLDAISET